MRQSSRAVLRQRSTKTVFPGIGPDTLEKFRARAKLLAARDGKPYLRTPSASRRLCIAISVFGRTWTYDAPGCQVSCETNRRARQIRFPCPSAYAQAFKLTGYHLANRNRDTRLLRRHLALALQVMESWGFRYSAVAFTWVKLNKGDPAFWLSERDFFMGQGHTTRKNAEFCLLRRRGLRSASAGISGSLLLRQDESIAASPTRPTSASSGMQKVLTSNCSQEQSEQDGLTGESDRQVPRPSPPPKALIMARLRGKRECLFAARFLRVSCKTSGSTA
jgi:hypothetical protein